MVIVAFDPGTVHYGSAVFSNGIFLEQDVFEAVGLQTTEAKTQFFRGRIRGLLSVYAEVADHVQVVYERARSGSWDESLIEEEAESLGLEFFSYTPEAIRQIVYANSPRTQFKGKRRAIASRFRLSLENDHSFDAGMVALCHHFRTR